MLIKMVEPDFRFENETGLLVQLVHEGWEQVNVLVSEKGCKRGGHFHKESMEMFYVIDGSLKLILEKDEICEEYNFKKGDFFKISPYQRHTFDFYEHTTMVSLYDKCVEKADGTKDIYK